MKNRSSPKRRSCLRSSRPRPVRRSRRCVASWGSAKLLSTAGRRSMAGWTQRSCAACGSWKEEYNGLRPHCSLSGLTPNEVVQQHSHGPIFSTLGSGIGRSSAHVWFPRASLLSSRMMPLQKLSAPVSFVNEHIPSIVFASLGGGKILKIYHGLIYRFNI